MKRLALLAAFLLLPALAADYGDVKFERKVAGTEDVPPAYFPHAIHRIQFKCGACHEELFKLKAGTTAITMDGIKAGETCGKCHDGKAAFESNFDTCLRCHVR
jgi:c(7)-type cytochrome triheme protein